MELRPALEREIKELTTISRKAFDSDILVGAPIIDGPPNYNNQSFHLKMAKNGYLYTALVDNEIIGGIIVFVKNERMDVGRIFVDPNYHRKGYGLDIMLKTEEMFPLVKSLYLDTPIWNVRTNRFYQKLGYKEIKRDSEFVYYKKEK